MTSVTCLWLATPWMTQRPTSPCAPTTMTRITTHERYGTPSSLADFGRALATLFLVRPNRKSGNCFSLSASSEGVTRPRQAETR